MRRALLAVLLCSALLATPARGATIIGIADQHVSPVTPLFTWTGIKTVRMVVPWDAALAPTQELDDRLNEGGAAGLDMVVAFEHSRGQDCRVRSCVLPSQAQMRAAFLAFRARWPWITAFAAWNEGNHPSQPTANRPASAAQLYQVLAAACPSCRIAAGDVVDIEGMATWLRGFLAALPETPRLWGLHNYGDVTYGRTTMTDTMLRLVPGDVWITETGGIVRWDRWPYDEERARASVERAFALADAHPDRIPRLYLYQWRAGANEAWDSGLLRPDGTPRPSFAALGARLRPDVPVPPVEPERPGTWSGDQDGPQDAGGARPSNPVAGPTGTGLRILRRPWLDREGFMRARVACPAGRAKRCTVALVIRQRPTRVGDRLPAAVATDRRSLPAGAQRVLRTRVPARVRRKASRLYTELRVPGRKPARSVVRVRRAPR